MAYINYKDRKIIIYKITCLVNGKVYVGRTEGELITRWRTHIAHSKMKEKMRFPLYKEMYELGVHQFNIEVLETSRRLWGMWGSKIEKYWMFKFNSISPNGYNVQKISAYYDKYIKGRLSRENKKINKRCPLKISEP